MGASGIRAGAAYIELFADDSKLVRGLRNAEANLRKFGGQLTRIGRGFMLIGGAAVAGFIPAIKAASDLQETMNKFNVVFGASAAEVKVWSDTFAKEIGRSKEQIASFMAGSQDLFIPLGFEAGAATEMSKQITKLSIDLASFNNMQDADTMRDLQAALTGSGEVMKKYGVIVSEAAVKQELLNQSIDPTAASNAEKVQARLNIIMRGTTAAQGDAARSAGDYANQVKALKAKMTDVGATIGAAVLPMITKLVGQVSEAAERFGEWAADNQKLLVKVLAIAGAVAALGVAIVAIGSVFSGAAAVIGGMTAAVGALSTALTFLMAHPVVLILAAIAAAGIALYIVMKKLTSTTAEYNNEYKKMSDAAAELRTREMGRLATLQKLAKLESLNSKEMALAQSIIEGLEAKYGDLGLTIDETTGKIGDMTNAFGALGEAEKAAKTKELEAKIKGAELKLDVSNAAREEALAKKKINDKVQGFIPDSVRTGLLAVAPGAATLLEGYDRMGTDGFVETLKATSKEDEKTRAEIQAYKDQLEALRGAGGDDLDEKIEAQTAKSDWEQDLDRRAEQLRIAGIENEEKRAIAAIKERYQIEREEREALGKDTTGLKSLERTEIQNIKENAAKDKAEKAKAEEKAEREQTRDTKRGMRDQMQRDRIQLDDSLDGLGKTLANIDLDEKIALREAQGTGISPELIQRQFDLKRELASQSDKPKDIITAAGTFSALAAMRMGGDNTQDRTARATEETARNTGRMNERLQEPFLVGV